MKKLFTLLFIFASIALAFNFNGSQSLNGLQTTQIFTAPQAGIYFVNGQLTLPWPNGNGNTGSSQVYAVVSKNASTEVYVGASGASGFQVNQISLVSGDSIQVQLISPAAVDQTINAVRGQVYYGNTF